MDSGDLLNDCMLVDQFDLENQHRKILRISDLAVREYKLQAWQARLDHSKTIKALRLKNLPQLNYPDLPIVQQKEKIIKALQAHNVIIIAGETGSGKTTQLPKICIEAGFGLRGFIGHTQPRRIAARAVATRIAQELQSEVGNVVGCKVRFADKTTSRNYLKIMTDGILLAETQPDKWLMHYDCLIIDEAHERSLNIDFLLGWLKNLLTKRPTLRVIVTSATIDVERFSHFFNQAPIIEVSGRTYPVEIQYLTELPAQDDDLITKVLNTTQAAFARTRGDILIFQSGEKEIREVVEALGQHFLNKATILPLYARLSVAEQQKVFQTSPHRKIIVATNVAETSITLANIHCVIDTGTARLSRYNYRSKIQRLPIEAISQASANQRAGRSGRTSAGICYRLYTHADYLARPLFTEPEILRTNLAAVILKMLALNFSAIESFPFIDPPDHRYVKDGLMLLERLQAVDEHKKITPLGRILATIPIEPKLARMLLGAVHYHALSEVLIIVSALSIVDPRERPTDFQAKADAAHAKFAHENSDFMTLLNLWSFITENKKTLSNAQFRKLCREHFLSFTRICEWFDVHEQLQDQMLELNFKINQVPPDYAGIHKSLLTGLIDFIGVKEDKEYLGARGTKFFCHPSSVLFKKMPLWLMACEIVHTSKTFARINAQLDPKWLEEVAGHLLKRHYFEPHFVAKDGFVIAFEKSTLFGLEVISKRKVNYEAKFPKEARAVFIEAALVREQLRSQCDFYQKNKATLAFLGQLELRIRRIQFLIDERALYEFYDKRLPVNVTSQKSLEAWVRDQDLSSLCFDQSAMATIPLTDDFFKQYPSQLDFNGEQFALEYRFEPQASDDGVTLQVPLETLLFLKDKDFSWLIPGWLADKIDYHLSALPKHQRNIIGKNFILAPNTAFIQALTTYLREKWQIQVPQSVWTNLNLPPYLQMHFKILYQHKILAQGDSLPALYEALKDQHSDILQEKSPIEKQQLTAWDFGDLPAELEIVKNQLKFDYHVAIVDDQHSVSVQLFDTRAKADYHHTLGLTRLYMLQLNETLKALKRQLTPPLKKTLTKFYAPYGDLDQFLTEVSFCATYDIFVKGAENIRTQAMFEAQLAKKRSGWLLLANSLITSTLETLSTQQAIVLQLTRLEKLGDMLALSKAVQQQLSTLLPAHFIQHTPAFWLKRYPLYLKGILMRLEKYPRQVKRDQEGQAEVDLVLKYYAAKKMTKHSTPLGLNDPLVTFQWRIEELRISLFAQTLGTVEPVSKIRLLKALENL